LSSFLNQNHIYVLPLPALSPDLSPIEHVWDELGTRIRHRQIPPETPEELCDALVHEWKNITQAFIQGLVGSMRWICEAAVAASGGHTHY
jgi:transposase